jgi:hypothetical protein
MRRRVLAQVTAGVLLCAAPLMAQRAPAAATAAATVTGVVVDSSGRPVRDAVVVIRAATVAIDSAGEANSRTDSLGRFRLGTIAPGAVVLMVHHAAFESIQADASVAAAVTVSLRIALNPVDSAALMARASITQQDLRASGPSPMIDGTVLAPDGTPIEGADVTAVRGGHVVRTDARGRWTLPREPGTSTLVRVRRIAWQAAFRAVPDSVNTLDVELQPLGQQLAKVTVRANGWSAQALREMDRRHWLYSGTLIGPDEIARRNAGLVSQLMYGRLGIYVRSGIVQGRNGCPLGLIINGSFVYGTEIDAMISPTEIVAIEAFPSSGSTPFEFLCGLGRRTAISVAWCFR